MRIKGNADVYVINADGGSPRRLTVNAAVDNVPSWSTNGKWIYFSSRRTGDFEIWRIPADGGEETQMTHQGGFEALESPDGKVLYYLKRRVDSPVWKIPIEGGKESHAMESANPARFNYWQPFDDGIYFVQRMGNSDAAERRVQFFVFATGKITLIGRLERPTNRRSGGFSVSPDRRQFLVALVDQDDSDIMLVENFR